MFLRLLMLLLSTLVWSFTANAGLIRYTFESGDFPSSLPAGVPGISRLSGSFVVDLPADFDGTIGVQNDVVFPGLLTTNDWFMSDGATTLGSGQANNATFIAGLTYSMGQFVGLGADAFPPSRAPGPSLFGDNLIMEFGGVSAGGFGFTAYCVVDPACGVPGDLVIVRTSLGGSVSATPVSVSEPGALSLFGAGVLALGILRRRAV